MAKSDSTGAGESGQPRPQVRSSVPAGEAAVTAAFGGDTAARSSSGPRELPAQFGPYRVKKKLGGGGMGTVYLVENTDLEREEALKVPHFGDGGDPQLRERFLREAKSAAKLDHANFCPIYAVGVQDGIYYLTMRFLKGKLLSDYTGKAQPARKAVEIVTKLAQALEAAHAAGVIHRDLKPSNVIMVGGVGPVVMDFGLAKQVRQPDKKLTQMGSMLGTPAYMPPEQVNGDLERMGPASDVYSLGVILYELLTGRLPFEGSMAAIFGKILYTEPPLPSALVPGLSPALDGICRTAMAKEPAERYTSMKAFAAALLDYLRTTPATDGAGNLVPTAVDTIAILQAPTAGPGPRPVGQTAIFQAATVAPGQRAAATVPPRVVEALPPPPARSPQSRPFMQSPLPWLIGGTAVLLAGLVGACLLAALILRVETKAGTVLLEIDEKDAEVYVDGDQITIGRPGDKNTITVQAKEGKHLLRVTKEGFEAWTDDITFRANEPNRVKISLKPLAVAQNSPKDKQEPSRKDPPPPNVKEPKPLDTNPVDSKVGPADFLLTGSVWAGTSWQNVRVQIIITGRTGQKFTGEMRWNNGHRNIEGTVVNGVVKWYAAPGEPNKGHYNVGTINGKQMEIKAYKTEKLIETGNADGTTIWGWASQTPEMPPAESFVPLFNGKDLTGWKTHPAQPGSWRVVNGMLTDTGAAGISHLYTERGDYKDFHLRVEARSGAFTGVYFRNQFGPAHPANKPIWLVGYNAKIDRNRLGGLIIDDAKNVAVIRSRVSVVPPGQWLTLEVIVERNQIVLKVDGNTTADYTDKLNRFTSGHITLQQHSAQLAAEFRKIEIKELSR